jgi:hypothetical protein
MESCKYTSEYFKFFFSEELKFKTIGWVLILYVYHWFDIHKGWLSQGVPNLSWLIYSKATYSLISLGLGLKHF